VEKISSCLFFLKPAILIFIKKTASLRVGGNFFSVSPSDFYTKEREVRMNELQRMNIVHRMNRIQERIKECHKGKNGPPKDHKEKGNKFNRLEYVKRLTKHK
jgi:hypothetical protein